MSKLISKLIQGSKPKPKQFRIYTTHDWSPTEPPVPSAYKVGEDWFVNIATIDELLALWEAAGQYEVIIAKDKLRGDDWTLEIYNEWRE